MSEGMDKAIRSRIRKEPAPGSIRRCETCPLNTASDQEGYISPMPIFSMDLSQSIVPAEERVGRAIVRVMLNSRQNFDMPDDDDSGDTTRYEGVLLGDNGDIKSFDVDPETWIEVQQTECDGPDEGQKRFIVAGPRRLSCHVLNMLEAKKID